MDKNSNYKKNILNNSLETINPILAKEWHPTKNGHLTPSDVTYGSNKKVWWQCDKGHEWQATIANRNNKNNCPYCSNRKVLKGYNDLKTINPTLAKQWHPTKNGDLKPTDVPPNSSKKVWWKCNRDHEWTAKIYHRNSGRNCPICNNQRKTSFPEQVIYYYLKKIFKNTSNRKIINKKEADIFIEELNLIIEYDGAYFHKNKIKSDIEKNKAFQDYYLIRIREKGLMPIQDYGCINHILKNTSNSQLEEMVCFILNYIQQHFSLTKNILNRINKLDIDLNRDQIQIYNAFIVKEEKYSLYFINPTVTQQWHPTKNGNLNPKQVTPNSIKKVWWFCDKGHEWQAVIIRRTKGSTCPYCSGRNVIKGLNDLETINPRLAQQWHPTQNGDLLPSDVTIDFKRKVWWFCDKGHEWQATVSSRNKDNNCPICRIRNSIKGYNDLQTINPKLSKQWHPTQNGGLLPSDVTIDFKRKVWWQCDKGHEWQATVSNRINNTNCPYCIKENILNNCKDLQTINPILAKQWHPTKNGNLLPSNVTYNSQKKVWWQCDKGHEWQDSISNRNNNGCPYCNNKKLLKGYNDLISINHPLTKQWHSTKNGHLTPNDVFINSVKNIWWQCDKGHEWQATVSSRINNTNCPICSHRKVLKGYNDLATINPILAKQWHPTKNGFLTSSSITINSTRNIWWQCDKGHEWQATVSNRNNNTNCPYCKSLKE